VSQEDGTVAHKPFVQFTEEELNRAVKHQRYTRGLHSTMRIAALPKWIALLTAVAMANVGCAHTQQPERKVYVISEDAEGVGRALATGGGGHDCQEEHEECVKKCWNKKNWPYPHNKRQSGWYLERCEHDCRIEFNKCEEEQEEAARERAKKVEFSRMDEAIEWLKAHKAEIALGTMVIVAGVVFILVTGGSGALLLVPLAL
jgi:hypothetical protein